MRTKENKLRSTK